MQGAALTYTALMLGALAGSEGAGWMESETGAFSTAFPNGQKSSLKKKEYLSSQKSQKEKIN
jgi:hypothetical protein